MYVFRPKNHLGGEGALDWLVARRVGKLPLKGSTPASRKKTSSLVPCPKHSWVLAQAMGHSCGPVFSRATGHCIRVGWGFRGFLDMCEKFFFLIQYCGDGLTPRRLSFFKIIWVISPCFVGRTYYWVLIMGHRVCRIHPYTKLSKCAIKHKEQKFVEISLYSFIRVLQSTISHFNIFLRRVPSYNQRIVWLRDPRTSTRGLKLITSIALGCRTPRCRLQIN